MVTSPRILVSHKFPPETAGTLEEFTSIIRRRLPNATLYQATNHEDTLDQIPEADIVIEHGLTDELLTHTDDLDWIHTLSSGADAYDRDLVNELGAFLTTVSGVHAKPVAEHVLALMLYFERGLSRSREQQQRCEWQRFAVGELSRRTLGVIGVGAIGGRIAELGSAFGMEILGLRQHPSKKHSSVDEMFGPTERHELLSRSDYVVLACPLTEETRGLIGKDEFSSMYNEAILINVSRGEVVDQRVLINKLQTGYIGGAALDVAETEPLPPSSPLWGMSNVIISPHIAGGSPAFSERCAEIFVENYKRFIDGEPEEMKNRII
jgi:phosphoglycerate dehydrogenase-like enzyme